MDGNKTGSLIGGKRDALPYDQLMQLLLVSANPVTFGCKRERKKIDNIETFDTFAMRITFVTSEITNTISCFDTFDAFDIILNFVTRKIINTISSIDIFETFDTNGVINLVEMVTY
jgi:hypothetical protein